MKEYDFHPGARSDLDEIWEFIASASINAADKMIADILKAVSTLVPFPHQGHRRTDLTSRPLRFGACVITSSPTRRMSGPCGSWL